MGRGKFRKGKGRGGSRGGHFDGRRRENNAADRYHSYPPVTKENTNLYRYYDTLLNLPEEEKAEFWAALQRELPNSFRFCGSKGHALEVMKLMQTRYIPEITTITHLDGQPVDPPKPVPWYPDSLAWWMTTPKNVVRKFPPFSAFQKFLVSETSVGNISRQEVVSMIPPLLLDVKPGMAVLDMCAAPGSKASQLLEMIHVGEESRVNKVLQMFAKEDGREIVGGMKDEEGDLDADPSDNGRATGILIANDADYKRSHMLIHQLKRLSSPNMIVTNHDATLYPSIRLPSDDATKGNYLKFDRILADVPCSGDGTLRKNVNLWKEWQSGSSLGLHLTQTRILVRALQMLKVGGKVVYSTCSMNPVENESVVAAAIDRCGGPDSIEILDCSDKLAGLKRVPGLKDWKIMDKAHRIWNSWEEVEEHAKLREDGVAPGRLSRTMFPMEGGAAQIPLERCMRIYAHLQDTGGFFITVLQKKTDFKAKPEAPASNAEARAKDGSGKATPNGASHKGATTSSDSQGLKRPREDTDADDDDSVQKKQRTDDEAEPEGDVKSEEATAEADVTAEPDIKSEPDVEASKESSKPDPNPPRRKKPDGGYEEPFKYIPSDHAVINKVKDFYGLSPRFPLDRFMVRNALGEPAKAIYYTSALVRDVLVANEGRGVKFVHGGVKMFMKQDAPSAEVCGWRIQSEGMPIMHGYVGPERVLYLRTRQTLRKLLVEMFPKLSDGAWRELGELGEAARDIGMGCCVLRVEPGPGDEDMERMALPLWKSFHSLNLMLPKEDRSAMLLRIFNETATLINLGLQRDKGGKTEGEGRNGAAPLAVEAGKEGDGEEVEVEAAAEEEKNGVGGMEVDNDTKMREVEDLPSP